MSSIRPLDDRLLVRRAEAKKTTEGGIVIPTESQTRPKEGIVVDVGPGRTLDNGKLASMQIKVGNRIMYTNYGSEVEVDGEKLLILSEVDILAVVLEE